MVLDCVTACNLELTNDLSSHNDKETLFGIMNETAMGARLPRSNILQSMTDERTISTRLDCVQELLQAEETLYSLELSLILLNDVDHLITAFIQVPTKPSILGLSEVIKMNVVLEKTAAWIRNQRYLAVKIGCNGLLDVARQTYKEIINDIFEVVNRYVEDYDIHPRKNKTLTFTTLELVKKNKTLTFTTLELVKKNAKINDSLTEVYLMSDTTVSDHSDNIRQNIGVFYKASGDYCDARHAYVVRAFMLGER
ncbi:MutS protein msh4, partial [Dissophora globulifera]